MHTRIITKQVLIPIEGGKETSGIVNVPEESRSDIAIIVAHGAGNDMHTPLLASFSEGLAGAGHTVLRFNFPYSNEGRKAPDRPDVLIRTWLAAYNFLKEATGHPVNTFIGAGKSMGGRIASEMVAEGILPVSRLIFLGYPLHPVNDIKKLRDTHLYRIRIPMLFFAGTRDPLCNIDLLHEVLKKLNAPFDLFPVDGGDHSFHVPKSTGKTDMEVYERITVKALDWLSE